VRVRAGDGVAEAAADFLERIRVRGPAASDPAGQKVDLDDPKVRALTVEATVQASLTLLPVEQAARLGDLAVFAPGQEIPFPLAAALWGQTAVLERQEAAEVADTLCDGGLATRPGDGQLRLHEVICDYLRSQLGQDQLAGLHGHLVEAAGTFVPAAESLAPGQATPARAWWELGTDTDAERYLDENLLHHMMEAGRTAEAENLTCDLRWVSRRLAEAGPASALADLAVVGTERARSLGGVIRRVMHMLGADVALADDSQLLLNALRSEPGWADQAAAAQAARTGAALVSRWPLPDNPGSALAYVLKVPWSNVHDGGGMALSPDGARLILGGRDGVYDCDLATRQVTTAFSAGGTVKAIAFSPDGLRAAVAEGWGNVDIRDARSWDILTRVADKGGIWSVAFTVDGKRLVTSGDSGRVKVWDAATGAQIRPGDVDFFPRFDRQSHKSQACRVAIVSRLDGRVVCGSEERVIIWDLPDGTPSRVLRGASWTDGLIRSVAAAPDCSWVAGAIGQQVFVWRDSAEPCAVIDAKASVQALAAAPDGSRLAAATSHGALLVWDSQDFSQQHHLEGHGRVNSLEFSPDGHVLYSGGGGDARAWDLRAASTDRPVQDNAPAERVLVSPKAATWVAVSLRDGRVQVKDAATGTITASLSPARAAPLLAAAPDGTWLVTGQLTEFNRYRTDTWEPVNQLTVPSSSYISQVTVSADGGRLLAADDLTLRAVDPATGQVLTTMTTVLRVPRALAFSPDGTWLAAGDDNGSIWIWRTASGDLDRTMRTSYAGDELKALAAVGNDTLLAYGGNQFEAWEVSTGSRSRTTRVWLGSRTVAIAPDGPTLLTHSHDFMGTQLGPDHENPDRVRVISAAGNDDTGLAFSGDSRWCAVSSSGRQVTIWDNSAATWPDGPRAVVPASGRVIALSRDGATLAVGDADSERLQLWDVGTAELLDTIELGHGIDAVAFSPTGDRLAIACADSDTSWVSILDDLGSGTERRLCGYLGRLQHAAESPDGRYLATVSARGVQLWEAESGRGISDVYLGQGAYGAVFGSGWLAVALRDSLRVYPLSGNGGARDLPLPDRLSEMEVTHKKGTRIIALTQAGRLLSVDVAAGLVTPLADAGPSAETMAVSPDGRWLAVGGQGIAVFSLSNGAPVTSHGMNRRVKSMAWSPDSAAIAAVGDGGSYYFAFSPGR
jgi:WD40 repeat protein